MERQTVNLHGREYETVASRVARFRDLFSVDEWAIRTTVLHCDLASVRVRAEIVDLRDGSEIVATGHAEEWREDGRVNRTSALENCETSAIGRALFAFGIGGAQFASADEMRDKAESPTARRWYEACAGRLESVEAARSLWKAAAIDPALPAEDRGRIQDLISERVSKLESAAAPAQLGS